MSERNIFVNQAVWTYELRLFFSQQLLVVHCLWEGNLEKTITGSVFVSLNSKLKRDIFAELELDKSE